MLVNIYLPSALKQKRGFIFIDNVSPNNEVNPQS